MNPPKRLQSLQALRAVAALSVVLFHTEIGIHAYLPSTATSTLFGWGSQGVPLFFILSGYVIAHSGLRRPRPTINFLVGRVARIYPVYLLLLGLFVACLLFLPQASFRGDQAFSWWMLTRSLLFNLGENIGAAGGYIYVGWTLFYEMLFYICFSLLIPRFPEIARAPLFRGAITLGLVACAISHQDLISDFLIGMGIVLLTEAQSAKATDSPEPRGHLPFWRQGLSMQNATLALAMVAAATASLPTAICTILIISALTLEQHRPAWFNHRVLLTLGDSSYSMYLVQVFTNSLALKLAMVLQTRLGASPVDPGRYWITAVILALSFSILAGILLRQTVEKPCYQTIQAIWARRRLSPTRILEN
jgi:exopolysaccharide production protein ExoZ